MTAALLRGLVCVFAAFALAAAPVKLDPPAPAGKPEAMGRGVQRAMRLMATSTPDRRNKVRILFYGQSITEQEWSRRVAEDLRRRFPNADLEIENRAIGGFASQRLIYPAEHDLYPFYPDLLIFHVYGANQQYEQIIREVRSRTTADVLMQKDHVTAWPAERPDPNGDKGLWWDHMMNHVFLPEIARKYGCGLVDVRSPWLAYLKANQLEPKALLKDGVHLNERGNALLAELVSQYLVYRPELDDGAGRDAVRTLEVGKEIEWKEGKLRVDFTGNRVDAIAGDGAARGPVEVRIDGKKPSEFPGCYRITRPAPGPWSPLFASRIDHERALVVEDWTLKITEVSADSKQWGFTVRGSVTGEDGAGRSDAVFVSRSGRVKIDPAAWFANGKIPVGYEIRWKVLPMFVDAYVAPGIEDRTREAVTTLAQGLANGRHTLEIGGPAAIRAIRVYRPAVEAGKP